MPYSWSLCTLLCLVTLTVWRLWLAVFSLLPVSVPLHPHHVSLQAHYIYIMCMYVTSTAVHFICFCGSHVGAYADIAAFTSNHITNLNTSCSCYSYVQHLPRCHCVSYFVVYHLWWFVLYGIIKAKRLFYLIWITIFYLPWVSQECLLVAWLITIIK